ncbi:bromodomain protein [Schizosaccharomyces japonicus yFS275]|uniref:Bromodomain protein n=1 Tax=Schizosaccharomyces japonicus (strain yFS275 / FY16936) TaxID=402676 RepID=B6K0Y3_SCHJY|nr:bromodomain protein [Schizosaccharomyces japonicus yFS275]EEB07604.1 bromodomain protein [Schizosaccharomyces japonicus yFS275]
MTAPNALKQVKTAVKQETKVYTPRSPEPYSTDTQGLFGDGDDQVDLFGDAQLPSLDAGTAGDVGDDDDSCRFLHPTPPYTSFDEDSNESVSAHRSPDSDGPSVEGDEADAHEFQDAGGGVSKQEEEAARPFQEEVRGADGSSVRRQSSEDAADAPPSKRVRTASDDTKTETAKAESFNETKTSGESAPVVANDTQPKENVAAGSNYNNTTAFYNNSEVALSHRAPSPAREHVPRPPLTKEQHKYIQAMLRQLRRCRDSIPFRVPVDPVKQNIPDYPLIIKHPMDLSTMQRKLTNREYDSAQSFIDDMNLMFDNCFLYNGTESPVGVMGKNLQATFTKQLKQLPSSYPVDAGGRRQRKGSMTLRDTTARTRRASSSFMRESSFDMKQRRRKDATEMKFCQAVLKELFKKQHETYAYPFYQPVDPVAFGCPDYFKVIKHPMDLGTMQNKLNHNEYANIKDFEADVNLVFKNCYRFNPPGTPVYLMGKKLETVFRSKWAEKPDFEAQATAQSLSASDYYYADNEVFGSDDEYDEEEGEEFEAVNRQINMLQHTLKQMKSRARSNPISRRRRARSQSAEPQYPPITYEMQTELAEQCNYLTAEQLTYVAEILRQAMPWLRDTDEIEIDVANMEPEVFYQVYYYVCKDKMPTPPLMRDKRKGRVLSEAEQAEKIRQLRAQLDRFNANSNTAGGSEFADQISSSGPAGGGVHESEDESSSSSDEDSESSDSA